MTMREVVSQLQSEGHQVEYYIRKDGGILIQKIDGRKFSGAGGNAYARSLLGQSLSERRASQLAKIKPPKIELKEDLKRKLRKTQRKWRQRFPHEKHKKPKVGRPTAKKIKVAIERGGETEAEKIIGEWDRYASGVAYSANVEHLAMYVEEYGNITGNPAFEELAEEIRANSANIREDWIQPAYQKLYELNSGGDEDDILDQVRRILRLS